VLVFFASGQDFSTTSRISGGNFSRCACNHGVTPKQAMRRKMDRRKNEQQLMGKSCKVRRAVATEIFQPKENDPKKAGRKARRDFV
jgi:hypothetical protein